MQFKEEEVVTKKSTIDVQSGEVHKVIEKDNTVSVVFQEEKNDVLMKCVLNLTKDQLAHINREHNIKPLAKEQLQAIHAKNDAAEIKEAALVPADPVVEITIPAKLNQPIKHLPTESYPPLNWKDKTPEREAKIYRSKIDYKKAGVIVSSLVSDDNYQLSIFEKQDYRHKPLMKTIDYINLKHGDKIKLANQDLRRKWKMKQEFLSPCYTTKISDVITIK